MEGPAVIMFLISFILLVTAGVILLYNSNLPTSPVSSTNSGIPNPNSSWIGAQCPVGCTCFPNAAATLPTDKPTQMCGYLANDTMFTCPAECCQPTCINQDVPDFHVGT
jgi:hypothetical protein